MVSSLQHIVALILFALIQREAYTAPNDDGDIQSLIWNPEKKLLFYLREGKQAIYSRDPSNGKDYSVNLKWTPKFIVDSDKPDTLIAGVVNGIQHGIVKVKWDGKSDSPETEILNITRSLKLPSRASFGPAKADEEGNLFFGVIDDPKSSARKYRIYKANLKSNENPATVIYDIFDLRSFAIDPNTHNLYIPNLTDDRKAKIVVYNGYDSWNKLVPTDEYNGFAPAYLLVNADGELIAIKPSGGHLYTVNKNGKKLIEKLPVRTVHSAEWGGENLDTLYVGASNRTNSFLSEHKLSSPGIKASVVCID